MVINFIKHKFYPKFNLVSGTRLLSEVIIQGQIGGKLLPFTSSMTLTLFPIDVTFIILRRCDEGLNLFLLDLISLSTK